MLRVLWINHRDIFHPLSGGAEVRMHEIAKRLVKKGYRITFLVEKNGKMNKIEPIDNRIVSYRLTGKLGVHFLYPMFVKKYGEYYDIIIDDIAHAVPWFSPLFTLRPVVAQIHHIHQNVLDIELVGSVSRILKQIEKTIPFIYDRYIAVSPSTKKELVTKFNIPYDKIAIIPNGVDIEKYRPGNRSHLPTILWIGRFKKYKRLGHVIKAFFKIKKEIKDSRLIIAGKGTEELVNLYKYSKLKNYGILIKGTINEEEKIRLMQMSWIVVSTSYMEGWGLTITEAASCGTPAIAYDVPGLRDNIIDGKSGFLVKSGDIISLATKIKLLLSDKTLLEKFGNYARMHATKYDWNNISNMFHKFLLNIA